MAIEMNLPQINNSLTAQNQVGIIDNRTFNSPIMKDKMRAFGGKFAAGMQDLNGKLSAGGISWGSMIGSGLSGIGSMIGNKYGDDFSEEQKASQNSIRSALAMIPGYGQLIAAATGAVDAIGSITGTNLSNINKNSAKRAGLGGSAAFNNTMNMLPGNSMIWGLMGGRTGGYAISDEAEQLADAYGGTVNDMRAAGDLANKRLLFGRRKADRYIDEARRNDEIISQINETNTMRKQSNYYQDLAHQNMNRYAGENYLGYRIGKSGMKLMSIDEAKAIINARKDIESKPNVEKFLNGGTVGIDSNILPEGALHARKNGLAQLNPDLEDATKKGIPVMAAEEGGELNQVAEIEKDEIVFRLEVTKRLEELMKDGSDEAMIEAGKLLTSEIIENTQDNTGQITQENGE